MPSTFRQAARQEGSLEPYSNHAQPWELERAEGLFYFAGWPGAVLGVWLSGQARCGLNLLRLWREVVPGWRVSESCIFVFGCVLFWEPLGWCSKGAKERPVWRSRIFPFVQCQVANGSEAMPLAA